MNTHFSPPGDQKESTRTRAKAAREAKAVRAERENILLRKSEQLEKSNIDLREFACLAWHDLQEPLRSIGIYTQLLKHRYEARLDEDADRMISAIGEGVERMGRLIQALLAFSRAGESEQPREIEVANASEALQTAIANLGLLIEESGATIDWDRLPTVPWSSDQLSQIFQNLLGNAIKYRGSEPPRVHVSSQSVDGGFIISVRDNGVGIAPSYQQVIFRPFRRLPGSMHPGSGIGLTLCQRIVERNGGKIWVESEPGQGATFRFFIPVDKNPAAHKTSQPPVRATPSSGGDPKV